MEFSTQPNFYDSQAYKLKRLIIFQTYKLQVFLSHCDLCGSPCKNIPRLCDYCLRDLPRFNQPTCMHNLLLWPSVNRLFKQRKFDQLISVAPYTWPFNQWLIRCKYQYKFEFCPLLAHILVNHWQWLKEQESIAHNPLPQLVVPIPMHISAWKKRGFNQAHLIAMRFAKSISIPYCADLLTRTKASKKQASSNAVQRRKNLKNSFAVNNNIMHLPRHILLVDDVITTGSTVNEACAVLKKSGVETITVLTVCLTLPSN